MSTDNAIQDTIDSADQNDVVVLVNRRKKATTREELERLPHEELIIRTLALQAHNTQLLNLLKKEQAATLALAAEKKSQTNAAGVIEYDTGVPKTQRKYTFNQ